MPALRNPRHEAFVKFVAGGANPAAAIVSAGFSGNGCAVAAHRLLKRPDILNRLEQLQTEIKQNTIERVSLSREWVLQSMKDVAVHCMEPASYKPAAAIRALELLGKELGLFRDGIDHTFKWNGDIAQLTEAQKSQLTLSLEEIAFRDNPDGLARWRAETAKMIDATCEPVQESVPTVENQAAPL